MRKLILSLILLSPTAARAVEIPDRNLRTAINAALGTAVVEFTEAHLADLINLDPGDRLIRDLTGLEHAINLETAVLDDNQLSDISPLSNLTRLRFLDLCDNRVTDLTALAGLTALEELILEDNDITDFSPLINLPNLTSLNLDRNAITTIPDLSGFTSLTTLSLIGNFIDPTSPETLAAQRELESRGGTLILRFRPPFIVPQVSIDLDPSAPAHLTISWPSSHGLTYQLQFSEDLSDWQPVTSDLGGTGAHLEISVPFPAVKQGFFQVFVVGAP